MNPPIHYTTIPCYVLRHKNGLINALNTPKASNLRRTNRCALGVHRAIYKDMC